MIDRIKQKYLLKILLLLMLTFFAGLYTRPVSASTLVYVQNNFVTLRVAPNTYSTVVDKCKIGQSLNCLGTQGSYTIISYKGRKCYTATSGLSKSKLATARIFKGKSARQFIKYIAPIAQKDYERSGVLASVTIAQAILESGYGKSTLAQKANNLFGMKKSLSGNRWAGSVWTGGSVRKGGSSYRKYNSVAASIADHSAYLTHAKKGSKLRYSGLTKTHSYKKQFQIIKKGGYCTSKSYVSQLCKIVKKYKLNQYD